ncbi:alpha/beta fold hydrolase [Microbispora sp. NPDC049633]|uniref:alpha/beta hydrolase n=1 Tax=Microbispora sp. NPDC049633 TaxID=3154355 RepID=UPI00343C14DC
MERGVVYGPSGKGLDVHRCDGSTLRPVVLLWHGRGPDERDVLDPLARAVAERGVVVFVPDWRSDAPDGGRAHLWESIVFVRDNAGDFGGDAARTVLAGWSLGGKAAAGVGVGGAGAGAGRWRPSGVVAIASGFDAPAPSTGRVPLDDVAATRIDPVPFWLVHGTRDAIVHVEKSRRFADALRERGWRATLIETETDHAGIVMTEYDPERGRCTPARVRHAIEAGRRTAEVLADAAFYSSGPCSPEGTERALGDR